jgi:hypothetical protein
MPLIGSAHAPPIKGIGADFDYQHEEETKNLFFFMSAILTAQSPPLAPYESKCGGKKWVRTLLLKKKVLYY